MWELIHEIGQSLRRNRTRTFLTGLAVVWGIFMLIVLLGVARGVVNSTERNMSSQNFESLTIWGGVTVYPYKGYDAGRWIGLKGSDARHIEDDNSHYVSDVVYTVSNDTASVSTINDAVTGGFQGVFPEQLQFERMSVDMGRFINERDIAESRRVMVIGRATAEQLFGSMEKALGSYVSALGLSWRIVGVYDHRWRRSKYVPYTTAKMISGNDPYVEEMTVAGRNLHTQEDAKAFQDGIVATLARLHEFDKREGENGGLWLWNRFDSYLRGQEGQGLIMTAVWVIGVLTLLTGIVGISNIMFVAVKERTHEIGIRRAIGAKPRDILVNVVSESVAITVIFGYIGIVLGMGVVAVLDKLFGDTDFMYHPGITLTMAVEVTIVLIVAGAVAGLFPAVKATKIHPVEALRDE